ncbi:MAG: alpha/beta hydrolase, partial [Luteimonas sp.]
FAAALVAAACVGVLALGVCAWVLRYRPRHLIRAEYGRQRRQLRLTVHRARIDGLLWCWTERAGTDAAAPPIVMLHGYTGSKENWYRLVRELDARYPLVMPDLPGWGDSERIVDADHGFVAEAAHVAAFLRHLDVGPVVLLGHSMGGGIAALVAARHPDLVARVGLLDAAGVHFQDNAFGLAVLDGRNPFGVVDAASLEHYLGILFHQRRARPPMPWPGAFALIGHRRSEGAFEQSVLDRIGRSDERFAPGDAAGDIRQPALLVWGAHDAVIDPSAMALYAARMPQARQVLLDRSGHMTLMEQPRDVADAVHWLIERGTPA